MGENQEPYLLLGLIGLGIWLFLLIAVPPRVYRHAWRNFRSTRGMSGRFLMVELRHFADLSCTLLLIPILLTSVIGGALLVIDEYATRLEVADYALEQFLAAGTPTRQGELIPMHPPREMAVLPESAAYLEHAEAFFPHVPEERFDPTMLDEIRDQLIWSRTIPLILVLFVVGLFLCWFMLRYHAMAVARYASGIRRRGHAL